MYTTFAIFKGQVPDKDRNCAIYQYKDGYGIQEKGLFIGELPACIESQEKRFDSEPNLLRIEILGLDGHKKTLVRK